MTWFETFSGKRFDLLSPDPAAVSLSDMAHSLARKSRFNGHVGKCYSVAEHCLWAWRIAALERPKDYLFQLQTELHDAHEYVTGDISRPMKEALAALGGGGALSKIENTVQRAIFEHFGLPSPNDADKRAIKVIDIRLLVTEHRCPALMPNAGEHQWAVETFHDYEGILDGTIGLESDDMIPGPTWNPKHTAFIRFPARAALQTPPDDPNPRLPVALFEEDIAFLFQSNTERLLLLVKSPP